MVSSRLAAAKEASSSKEPDPMAASASPASSSSSAPSRRIASSARSAPSSAEAASSVSPSARSPAHAVPSRGGAGDPAAGEPHREGRREACFVRRHVELDEARKDDATTKTRRVDSASLGARLAMRGGRGHDAVAHMLLFSSASQWGAQISRNMRRNNGISRELLALHLSMA